MSEKELHILVFGQLTDIIGGTKIVLPLVADVSALKKLLQSNFPKLGTISYVIAVDKKKSTTDTIIHPDSTIALLPPFSGG
jgi:molybdopterin converting factor small subunit